MTKTKFQYYEEPEIVTLKNGEKLTIFKLESVNPDGYAIKKVQKLITQKLLKITGLKATDKKQFKVSCLYETGWHSNYYHFIDLNNIKKLKLYDPNKDYNLDDNSNRNYHISAMNIIIRNTPEKKGGKDEYNNCLYHCLKDGGVDMMEFDKPYKLKMFLKLGRASMIPLKYLPKIEHKLKVNINVTGDYLRTSEDKYQQTINLNLSNSHYTYIPLESNNIFLKGCNFGDEKAIIMCKDDLSYDGQEITKFNHKDYRDSLENIKHPRLYITTRNDIVEEYNTYIREAEKIKTLTNGEINLFKNNVKNTAKILFFKRLKAYDIEELNPVESHFIKNSFKGGLIACKAGEYNKHMTCIDINSMYPSIIQKTAFYVPFKQGIQQKITNEDLKDFFRFGIYRCKITGDINPLYFRINKDNYYTHIDLKRARELNYKIDMIEDENINFMYFEKRANGNKLFGDYINTLYKLKSSSTYIKKLLNILWGLLCEYDIKTNSKTAKCSEGIINVKIDENIIKFDVYKNHNIKFKYNLARMGPFLTAQGRYNISKYAESFPSTVRVHTDSLVIDTDELHRVNTSSSIGEFKVEKQYLRGVFIKNVNDIMYL